MLACIYKVSLVYENRKKSVFRTSIVFLVSGLHLDLCYHIHKLPIVLGSSPAFCCFTSCAINGLWYMHPKYHSKRLEFYLLRQAFWQGLRYTTSSSGCRPFSVSLSQECRTLLQFWSDRVRLQASCSFHCRRLSFTIKFSRIKLSRLFDRCILFQSIIKKN